MAQLWLNGSEVDSLSWSVLGGHGFLHGVRVMTSMLAIGRHVIDQERHLLRLQDHCSQLGLPEGLSSDLLRFEIEQSLVASSSLDYSRVRVILFENESGHLQRLIAVSKESRDDLERKMQQGVKLSLRREPSWQRGAHIKTGIIGVRSFHLNRAKKNGFDDILWSNGDGELAEATWGNIFLIGRTGDLVEIATPPPSSGILEGITRRRIIELLGHAQIPVTVRVITDDEVPRFDEAFTSSSIAGLVPVNQIGAHRLHTLRKNGVFSHVSRLYQTWISKVGLMV